MTDITQSSESPPLVWLLLGERRGDNAQVLALARRLGWPFVAKQLHWAADYDVDPREAGASRAGLDQGKSDALVAPWPDIVIGIGFRSAPVSRWIVAQGPRPALNIRLGRPRTELSLYDLVVTTPQYGLPPGPNVREVPLPFVAPDPAAVAAARARWQDQLAALPRPWTAVLIGGPTQHMAFDEKVATDLGRRLEAYARHAGGALLITTSPRSPDCAADLLARAITTPHFLHRWRAEADNPYLALLAEADRVIVTSDSMSMAADAAAFDKPILIYELPWLGRSRKPGLVAGVKRWVRERRERRAMASLAADPLDRFYDRLTLAGKARPRRNALEFLRRLYESGIARPLEDGAPDLAWRPLRAAHAAQEAVVAEIRALWAARR